MKKCFATVSFSGTLPEKLSAIANAGFSGIELLIADVVGFGAPIRKLRRLCEGLGLTIEVLQPMRDFEGVDSATFRINLDRAEELFDTMAELQIDLLLLCSNVSSEADASPSLWIDQLSALAERAGKRGMRIGYEALSWGTHVNTFDQAWQVVRSVDHHAFGLVLDSFHTLAPLRSYRGLSILDPAKIFFVQIADAPRLSLDLISWSRHHRCLPGQGELDVVGFMTAVAEIGYNGPVSLEVFSDDLKRRDADAVAREGMLALQSLENAIARMQKPLAFEVS